MGARGVWIGLEDSGAGRAEGAEQVPGPFLGVTGELELLWHHLR